MSTPRLQRSKLIGMRDDDQESGEQRRREILAQARATLERLDREEPLRRKILAEVRATLERTKWDDLLPLLIPRDRFAGWRQRCRRRAMLRHARR
jgi:hypothetical protein